MTPLTLIEKVFLLRKVAPFRTLNLDALLPIADKLLQSHFNAKELLFSVGEESHRIYFIVQGAIRLYTPRKQREKTLGPEECFGDEALFAEKPRGYSATSLEASCLLSLSRTHLLTVVAEFPSVALGFLALYADRLPDRACL